ncbi:hypothetical protein THMIRHAT_19230 [Thiosulfativibrio zosterae]|uniref:Uncharacterized protein n=1 Tax=Thiosulfativibrio zosterae TaxID=2675053 RepID=A0A6F8PQ66_9GAMM|nr:hypothetical protein THMIRHAT_19230 [Thiosulfativibrio zosterae]
MRKRLRAGVIKNWLAKNKMPKPINPNNAGFCKSAVLGFARGGISVKFPQFVMSWAL